MSKVHKEVTEYFREYVDLELEESVHYIRKKQAEEALLKLENKPLSTLSDAGFEKISEIKKVIYEADIQLRKSKKDRFIVEGQIQSLSRIF